MIIANGTTGTIGKYLINDVIPLQSRLEEGAQETELEHIIKDDWSLIHLAGVVGPNNVDQDLHFSNKVNVESSLSLGHYAFNQGVRKFVFISTSHVYAQSQDKLIEHADLAPVSNYAKQKLDVELGLARIFSSRPTALCIVRVFSILDWNLPNFTLGGAIERAIRNPQVEVIGQSLSERDFLTPSLVAKGILEITKSEKTFGIINLCSGIGLRVIDVAQAMAAKKGVTLGSNNFDLSQPVAPRIVGDNSKFTEMFPNIDLRWDVSYLSLS